jgi:hypothetical protein
MCFDLQLPLLIVTVLLSWVFYRDGAIVGVLGKHSCRVMVFGLRLDIADYDSPAPVGLLS